MRNLGLNFCYQQLKCLLWYFYTVLSDSVVSREFGLISGSCPKSPVRNLDLYLTHLESNPFTQSLLNNGWVISKRGRQQHYWNVNKFLRYTSRFSKIKGPMRRRSTLIHWNKTGYSSIVSSGKLLNCLWTSDRTKGERKKDGHMLSTSKSAVERWLTIISTILYVYFPWVRGLLGSFTDGWDVMGEFRKEVCSLLEDLKIRWLKG